MADRATLHLSKLGAFAAWMAMRGWAREDTKGVYEVLRLRRENGPTLVFYSRSPEHATIPMGDAGKWVSRWLRARKAQGVGRTEE